jgi:hypothetical protein
MKFGIIYTYIYIHHIYVCIYISVGAKKIIVFLKLKMVLDGEYSFEVQSKIQDFKVVSDIQPSN